MFCNINTNKCQLDLNPQDVPSETLQHNTMTNFRTINRQVNAGSLRSLFYNEYVASTMFVQFGNKSSLKEAA